MKRLTAKCGELIANIPITHITTEHHIVYAYNDKELVGVFSLGVVDALYVTEVRER